MSFYMGSRIVQGEGSAHFIFSNNQAQNRGGAIFVEDVEYSTGRFYHSISLFLEGNNSLVLDFFNNTAKLSGNEVHGGWINSIYKAEFNIINDNHYAVTSNPLRVCMCTYSSPKCVSQKNISIFHGQTFRIEAVAVGQRYGIVPGAVYARLLDSESIIMCKIIIIIHSTTYFVFADSLMPHTIRPKHAYQCEL